MAEKWEYKSVNYGVDNSTEVTNKLNLLGDEGWEAVGISQKSNAAGITLGFYVLLKRPQTETIAKQAKQAKHFLYTTFLVLSDRAAGGSKKVPSKNKTRIQ